MLIILLVIIIFCLSIWFRQIIVHNPYINLLKPLLPSWKFFDESNQTPVMLIKSPETNWQLAFKYPAKKWWNLFINPEGNFYLSYHSHLQQLLGELSEFEGKDMEFHQTVVYKLTEKFALFSAHEMKFSTFYFKISAIKILSNNEFIIIEDILLSPLLSLDNDNEF